MIIGIDVGGTHTDGVLLVSDLAKNYKIARTSKVMTDQEDLKNSILRVLDSLISGADRQKIERIVLSTTLATNTLVEKKYQPVGLILIPGPGLNPEYLQFGDENAILSGYINHRGQEVKPLSGSEIKQALKKYHSAGISNLAIVGKFSIRNPSQELEVKKYAEEFKFQQITVGHRLSGGLNFPRRVATAYFNAAITPVHLDFIRAIRKALEQRKITAPLFLLKCDGGTIPLAESKEKPIATVNSGPAASIMGTLALSNHQDTCLVLDIGGTTTDIGLFIEGVPVFMPRGIEIAGLPTLVRGLYTRSVPRGGDSEVRVVEGRIKVGPRRLGPAAARGGPAPTPTDALLVLGKIREKAQFNGESVQFNRETALKALLPLYDKINWQQERPGRSEVGAHRTEPASPREKAIKVAEGIIAEISARIGKEIEDILSSLENRPVYTIHELLAASRIRPRMIISMGGPAKAFTRELASRLGYSEEVIPYSGVANAVGAACARPTLETTVHADTAQGYVDIIEAGIHRKIKPGSRFTLEEATKLARKWTEKRSPFRNIPVEITEKESFNVIRGFRTTGKIMEVKAQIKPGLLTLLGVSQR
ncbi:MAG: hypothetical protein PWR10_1110 [Halanaerobiales bacterium]|nr:hypothetical protein [Halanaerobiales bacterium]